MSGKRILGVQEGGGRRVMNAAPPTMVRNPVTLTITPTTSTDCVVINPTTYNANSEHLDDPGTRAGTRET